MGQPTENMRLMGQGHMFQISDMCILWTPDFHHEHMNLLHFRCFNFHKVVWQVATLITEVGGIHNITYAMYF